MAANGFLSAASIPPPPEKGEKKCSIASLSVCRGWTATNRPVADSRRVLQYSVYTVRTRRVTEKRGKDAENGGKKNFVSHGNSKFPFFFSPIGDAVQ